MKFPRKTILGLFVVASAIGVVGSDPAQAALYEFTFSGAITEITGTVPAPWDGVELGSAWEFSYRLDSEAEDLIPGNFEQAFFLIDWGSITVAGVTHTTNVGELELNVGFPTPFDEYRVHLFDLPLGSAKVDLTGFNVFESDILPTTLNLEDFTLKLFVTSGLPDFIIRGDVTSFTSVEIPTPGAFFPLLSIVACAAKRRRR